VYDAKKYDIALSSITRASGRLIRSAALCVFLVVACGGCAAPSHAASAQSADALSTPDAVYEIWEQHWTLNSDGTTVYREKTHLRLNSDRTYDDFGDPRIAFNKDTDVVEVLTARTKMVDGRYVELADYSTVEVAPDASAGWPAFGGITQMVQVMGGIEAGCMLEREHKITTKAGVRPYLAADVHIDNQYPVLSHSVLVSIPSGTELSPFVSGISEDKYVYSFEQSSGDMVTHRWDFTALKALPNEAQAPHWQSRGVRLAFTTAPDETTWLKARLDMIEAAADESPLASDLAQKWTEDANTASEKLDALQDKFSGSFNFVNITPAWRPAQPRPALEVLNCCYGLPAESAAVLLTLARSSGVAVQPALLVNDETWRAEAPQAAMSSQYVLLIDGDDGPEIWHPRHGRIRRDSRWAGHTALSITGDKLTKLRLPAWDAAADSRCRVTGAVTIDEEGAYSGVLTVKITGLFVKSDSLKTTDGQRGQVSRMVNHVIADAQVDDFTLKSLTDGAFETEARISSDGKLEKLHDLYRLDLAQTSPALNDVAIPLRHSRRQTAARLVGPFDESIDLTVNWPEDWLVAAAPASVDEVGGDWGAASQTVTSIENGFKLQRRLRVNSRDLSPEAVVAIRKPLNELRSDHARTLLLKK